MTNVRGAPYQAQTQRKIERWHQTLKNHSLSGDLDAQVGHFIKYCNHHWYHANL
jgi:hypothetical protein